MPPAQRRALTVDKGATLALSIHYLDPSRNPIDLTGFTATFSLYVPDREELPAVYSQEAIVTNDGWIHVNVDDETTALWPTGKRAYNLDLENPDGDVTRLLFGPLEVRSGVNV